MSLRSRAKYHLSPTCDYVEEGGGRYLIVHELSFGATYDLRHGMFGVAKFMHFVAGVWPSIAQQSCKHAAYSGVRRARHNLLARVSRAREVAVPGQTKG